MKQKVLLLFALLLMAVTGTWATTVTWTSPYLNLRSVNDSHTESGITVTLTETNGMSGWMGSRINAFGGVCTFVFSSTIGNFKGITINCVGSTHDASWAVNASDLSWSGTPASTVTLSSDFIRTDEISSVVFTIEEPTPAVTLTDGNDLSALSAYAGQTVSVNYSRSFTESKASTVCLPFAYTPKTGEKFYTFTGITKSGSEYTATMSEVAALTANTPYLFMPSATGDVDFSGTYTLPATIEASNTESGDWKFYGTYTTLTYGTAPFSGHVYGFAAQAEGDVKAGQFVKATTGATVPPMRCYLTYKDGEQYSEARSLDGLVGSDPMPQTITVRLIDIEGNVTSIGAINTRTSEFTTDGWYTLDGHRLLGKPSKKGLYINNGKKVIIK